MLITRGEQGMWLSRRERRRRAFRRCAREVSDVTGAGDTVVATLALALAAGATMTEAAILANHAAGIVVGKFGPATVTLGRAAANLSVPEVAAAGEDHREAVLVGGGDHFRIADRAAGLDDRRRARRRERIETVAEREERVRRRDGSDERHLRRSGFHHRDVDRIDAAHLARADCERAPRRR